MKYIQTGRLRSDVKRKWFIEVDDEDFEWLNKIHWQADKYKTVASHSGKQTQTLIYRLIWESHFGKIPKGLEIDHINGNRLNNQKSNLRLATSSQNKINRGPRKDNKSGYKGVSWHKQQNKWTARIMANEKYLHLGLFTDIQEAVRAYNKAAIKYQGSFAWLNILT